MFTFLIGGKKKNSYFKVNSVECVKLNQELQYPCHMDNDSKSVKREPLFKSVNIQQRKLHN